MRKFLLIIFTALSVCNANSQNWSQFIFYPNSDIRALAEYNGSLYIGGRFSSGSGIVASNIIRWDGSTWSTVGSGCDDQVNALTVYNGELYVAGNFNTAGGVTSPKIAKWNGTTWSAVTTNPHHSGSTNPFDIYSLFVYNIV